MTSKERLLNILEYFDIGQAAFEKKVGISNGYVNNLKGSIGSSIIGKISASYPEINTTWLLTGNGEMLKTNESLPVSCEYYLVPLLPVSAQGGSLNDFVISVKEIDCEKIISPVKGADFAITVSGDSMSPEYPSGSKVLIKKINESAFIDWGRCYVLDTCNGTVIKELRPSPKDGCVKCVSLNKDQDKFAPYEIEMSDVNGVYRVLMLLTEK